MSSRKVGKCAYCNALCILTRDHVVPRSQGGKTILLVCSQCNQSKKNLSLVNWIATLSQDSPQHIYASRFLEMPSVDIQRFGQSQKTFKRTLTWKISGVRICWSDKKECWIHDTLFGKTRLPLEEKYWNAPCSHTGKWILSDDNPWKLEKPLSFQLL